MNDETRAYRDHVEGTVRRILFQYAYLEELLHSGASAVRLSDDTIVKLGGESDVRMWCLTVGVILSSVDRDLKFDGAWKATGRRLCGNQRWIDIADALHMPIEGAKDLVDRVIVRLYAEIVARDISEDYRHVETVA